MVGWHHQLNGLESEQTPGDSEGREAWHAAAQEPQSHVHPTILRWFSPPSPPALGLFQPQGIFQ